jgi:2-deoxy-D-gluconate 3-dehydrogenase
MSKPLEGKIAVVTGAGNGIGRASALRLSADGAVLALLDLDKASVEEVASEITASGGKALAIALDCSDAGRIAEAFATIRDRLGEPDILLNNVGQSAREKMSDFVDADMAVLDFILDVNLKSCILCAHQVAGAMKRRGSGKIINIASLLTFFGGITVPGYAASKGAVGQLTKALSNEWSSKGVNVNAIAPGYMRTDNTAALQADAVRSKEILSRIPANRWGEPGDMDGAIVFLSSSASDYLSGIVMPVDGGWCGR